MFFLHLAFGLPKMVVLVDCKFGRFGRFSNWSFWSAPNLVVLVGSQSGPRFHIWSFLSVPNLVFVVDSKFGRFSRFQIWSFWSAFKIGCFSYLTNLGHFGGFENLHVFSSKLVVFVFSKIGSFGS